MSSIAGPQGQFDSEELLHLALDAMRVGRNEDAMSCLKRALVLEPDNGLLHHLLGAVYAELGMTDRAIAQMTTALECIPNLLMARFQLGMLHFTNDDIPAAAKVWEPLGDLPEDDPLRLFRSGMLLMARDDFAGCVADLRRGVELNAEYASLNHDMQALIERTERAMANAGVTAGTGAGMPPASAPRQHVLLSGYQGRLSDKN